MRNRLYLLYSLLFIYILISLLQYNYIQNAITEKENYIEKLNMLLDDNDEFEKFNKIEEDFSYLNIILDTIIDDNKLDQTPHNKSTSESLTDVTLLEDASKNNDSSDDFNTAEENNDALNSNFEDDETFDETDEVYEADDFDETNEVDDTGETGETKNRTSIEEQKQKIKESRAFFKGITSISSSYKKHKPIKREDKTFWIIIQSQNGNYKNSIQNIISQINVNGSYVIIKDVKEQLVSKSKNGYITNYFIKVKLVGQTLGPRNRLTIYADQEYMQWFMAI